MCISNRGILALIEENLISIGRNGNLFWSNSKRPTVIRHIIRNLIIVITLRHTNLDGVSTGINNLH